MGDAWPKDHLSIFPCNAPTSNSEEEDKDQFYRLQKILETYANKDVTILMGDINAKFESDKTGYDQVMATHGLGVMNENEERFEDLCALNNLVIRGSIFPNNWIHNVNGHHYTAQIRSTTFALTSNSEDPCRMLE